MSYQVQVVLATVLGALAGVALFNLQPAGMPWMNPLGVVSVTFLGTAFGCLMADVSAERR